jgi:hypothetical protein
MMYEHTHTTSNLIALHDSIEMLTEAKKVRYRQDRVGIYELAVETFIA